MQKASLSQFLCEQQRRLGAVPEELQQLIENVAGICSEISHTVNRGALGGILGDVGRENIQGEVQKKLDVIANDLFLASGSWDGRLSAMASEEMDTIHLVPEGTETGGYLLLFDPIDGSSNVDVALSVGTIFSILKAPDLASGRPVSEADFFQAGRLQVAAGYVIYGPQTLLVLTVGTGVAEFALDRDAGTWIQTGDALRLPLGRREFAINMSNHRYWARPVRQYIDECVAGVDGPRGVDFNMRWTGSMVADIHRILKRGGIFLYPWDSRDPKKPGKLRLLYEANPMGFLMEQAGGGVFDGTARILDIAPQSLHQRVGVIMGDPEEVARVASYHHNATTASL